MSETLFRGLFDTASTNVISVNNFLLCIAGALVIGIILINKVKKYFEQTKSILKKQEEEIAKLKQSIDPSKEAETTKLCLNLLFN